MLLIIIILPVFHYIGQACIPTQQIEYAILLAEEIIAEEIATTTTTTTSTTTTPIVYVCPDSTWTLINRADYYWCAYILNGVYLMSEYEAECANINANAVVWGVQDQGELQEILTLIRAVETSSPSKLCLGALRETACYAVAGVSATCTALNSYYWTDGYTTGTDGFIWAPGYPENLYGASGDPSTYLYLDSQIGGMKDYYGGANGDAGLCGMLATQLN